MVVIAMLLYSSAAGAKQQSSVDTLVRQFVDKSWESSVAPASENHSLMVSIHVRRDSTFHAKQNLSNILIERLHGMLREKQGPNKLEILHTPSLASAKELSEDARNANYTRLLVVEIYAQQNHIHMVGKHYEIRTTIWDRIRKPEGGARGHYFARKRIDAEFRTLLSIPPLRTAKPQFEMKAVPLPDATAFIAGTSGDIDGDGFQEIVLLSANAVHVYRWLPDRSPVAVTQFLFTDIPRRTRRSRTLFGHILATDLTGDHRNEVAFWTSDLEYGLVLSWNNQTLRALNLPTPQFSCGYGSPRTTTARLCGPPLMMEPRLDGQAGTQILQGEANWGQNTLRPRISVWTTTEGGRKYHPWQGVYWNLVGRTHVQPTGKRQVLRATIDPNSQIVIRTSGHHWTLKNGNGFAATITDLNDDGEAELVRTTDSRWGQKDAIVIHPLSAKTHAVPEIWRHTTKKHSVVSLSSGDMDNNGYIDILALQGGLPYQLTETHSL